jgi:hypothetical protein
MEPDFPWIRDNCVVFILGNVSSTHCVWYPKIKFSRPIKYFHRFNLHSKNGYMQESNKDCFQIRISPGSGTAIWFSFKGILLLPIMHDISKSDWFFQFNISTDSICTPIVIIRGIATRTHSRSGCPLEPGQLWCGFHFREC